MNDEAIALAKFRESLPERYQHKYSESAISAHCRLSLERGDAAIKVGLFQYDSGADPAVCVVAKDQPGLLSTISAAFSMCDYDVVNAEAYTRKTGDGSAEAVDVFWVIRRTPEGGSLAIDVEGVQNLEKTIVALWAGELSATRRRAEARAATESRTRIRFVDAQGALSVLEIETDDCSGLLSEITHSLFQAGVQIVSSEVRTHGGRVYDRFEVVEPDGGPISPERRLQVQVAVLGAIDQR